MTKILGLAALLVFTGACVGILLSMQRRESRLDVAREDIDTQAIIFETPVHAKVKVGRGVVFKPIRARTRLLIREASLQIMPDAMRRNRLLGSEVIMPISGSQMTIRQIAFPLVRRRSIVISGLQMGERMGIAMYSKDGIDQIWTALQDAGVRVESPGSTV